MVFKLQTFHNIPPQVEIDDPTVAGLEARVAEALARAGTVDASDVEITVAAGRVTLTGTVGTPREIETVGEIAARAAGAEVVDNRVQASRSDFH